MTQGLSDTHPDIGRVGRSLSINSTRADGADSDTLVWDYILNKYSSTGRNLTKEEFNRMVLSMQKCDVGQVRIVSGNA